MAPALLCHICQQQDFDKNASLALHYYKVHEAVYCCQYCNHQFCTIQDRDAHVNKNHASPAAFCCIFCDVRSRQKKEMTHHQKENHPAAVKDFTCSKCDIILPDKECFNIHNDFCRGKPAKEENRGRHRSVSETRGPQASTPKAVKPDPSDAPLVCQYCPQQFSNRDDHCRHLIFVHQAGVMCSYCNIQLIAPPGDHAASLKVFKEHLEREHKSARHWVCIYCGFTVNDRQGLMNHQESARHRIMSCHLCSALMPTHTALVLHKEFQHRFISDQPITTDQPSRNNTPSALESLCLCCFRRYPFGNLRQHLLQHVERECEWISCNECFDFIQHPADFDKHMACFEREAKRHAAYMAGDKSTFSLCHCGFCASSQKQLGRHNGWCHKELACLSCKETEFGFVGMKRHMCMPPNGKATNTAQRGPGQLDERASGSPRIPRESGTPQHSQTESANNGGLAIQPPPPLPVATQAAIDATTGLALELPDSPEEITIKEEHGDSTLAAPSTIAPAPTQQSKSTPAQTKNAQKASRPRKDSSSSSSSSSSDDIPMKKTTPASIPKTAPAKRPLEKKKTPTSAKQAQKRPRVQSKPASSESSSSSSSDSEDEQPPATMPKPKTQAPPAIRKQTIAANRNSSSSSSSSSSDDESAAVVQRKSTGTANKATPSDVRPKISSVFSIKDTNTTEKRKSANGVLPTRQNVFAAAASVQKGSVEPVARATASKRKIVEETHNAADIEHVCTLCNQASVYRANVIRHLEIIHRIRLDMCAGFCQTRERPKPAMDEEEEEEEEEEEQSKTRTIAVGAKKTCLDCKLWQKKVQSMEKVLAKIASQITKARKGLEEELNE